MSTIQASRDVVDVVCGLCKPLAFEIPGDRGDSGFSLFEKKYDRLEDAYIDVEHRFYDPAQLREWLGAGGIQIASAFLEDLDRHFLGQLDLRCVDQRTTQKPTRKGDCAAWRASLEDVLRLPVRSFDVSWSLSHDSPEDVNEESFDTLPEAWAALGETGAMCAIPGNSGAIRIGSVLLYATWFKSDGIDAGDSHIAPRMQDQTASLFEQLLAAEKAAGIVPLAA